MARRRQIDQRLENLYSSARKIRAEIAQFWVDFERWNNNGRKPGEEPIDPDPDGVLARIAAGLDRFLEQQDAARAGATLET